MDPNDGWHFTAQKGTESFSPNLRENQFNVPGDTGEASVDSTGRGNASTGCGTLWNVEPLSRIPGNRNSSATEFGDVGGGNSACRLKGTACNKRSSGEAVIEGRQAVHGDVGTVGDAVANG